MKCDRAQNAAGSLSAVSVVLFVALLVRLFFLQVIDYKASVAAVQSNSLRTTTIPATRGAILDRQGQCVGDQHHHHRDSTLSGEAVLHPTIKGSLASLTGLSVKQIGADLANKQYDRISPRPL